LNAYRTVILRKDKFDEREEDFYAALYTQSQAQVCVLVLLFACTLVAAS
jgi:hypothetical protein